MNVTHLVFELNEFSSHRPTAMQFLRFYSRRTLARVAGNRFRLFPLIALECLSSKPKQPHVFTLALRLDPLALGLFICMSLEVVEDLPNSEFLVQTAVIDNLEGLLLRPFRSTARLWPGRWRGTHSMKLRFLGWRW